MTRPKILLAIITLALLGIVLLYFTSSRNLVSESAEVSLPTEAVSAQVTGYVTEVLAQNGQTVAIGDVLVRLDPTDYEVALNEARAMLAAMQKGAPQGVARSLYAARSGQTDPAELEARLAGARQEELAARGAVEDLSTEAAGATLARRRVEAGNGANLGGLKSREQALLAQLDLAREKFNAASQFRVQAEQDLERQKEILRQMDNQTIINEVLPAQIEAQAARVRQAELNLTNTEIIAPVAGQVIMQAVEPGQVVSPGQPLMAVIAGVTDTFYVTAVFPMEQGGKALSQVIKPGQYCEISLPGLDNLEFTGRVENVALPGTTPFALPGGASNSAEATPRLSVRVAAEHYDPQTMPPLQPGMQAVVRIDPEKMAAAPAGN